MIHGKMLDITLTGKLIIVVTQRVLNKIRFDLTFFYELNPSLVLN